jgi:hypothetical protein
MELESKEESPRLFGIGLGSQAVNSIGKGAGRTGPTSYQLVELFYCEKP